MSSRLLLFFLRWYANSRKMLIWGVFGASSRNSVITVYVCQPLGGAAEGWWARETIGVQLVLLVSRGMWVTCISSARLCWLKKRKKKIHELHNLAWFFSPSYSPGVSGKVLCCKISRLMLLRSLYLWPSVQITAIRLFTCELKLSETKRSAFSVCPGALKEEDNTEFKGVILQGEDYSEFWGMYNSKCTLLFLIWCLEYNPFPTRNYKSPATFLFNCGQYYVQPRTIFQLE